MRDVIYTNMYTIGRPTLSCTRILVDSNPKHGYIHESNTQQKLENLLLLLTKLPNYTRLI